jgi:DNA-binding MarR family transcriptional regulator
MEGAVYVSREGPVLTPDDEPEDTSSDDLRIQIDLRLRLEEVADAEAELLRTGAPRQPTQRELCQLACRIFDARRARDKVLDRRLFGEPGWDMLLALYCLPARGKVLATTSLAYCADVPQTTALRWERVLEEQGMIERGPHVTDRRLRLVRLTPRGRSLMDEYLTRLFYCSTPVPPHPERAGN